MGWVISDRIGPGLPDLHCFENHLLRTAVEHREDSDTLRQELHKFCSVEIVGSSNDCMVSQSENDVEHDDERYVTKLPFKPDHAPLPDNFNSTSRLAIVAKKSLEICARS